MKVMSLCTRIAGVILSLCSLSSCVSPNRHALPSSSAPSVDTAPAESEDAIAKSPLALLVDAIGTNKLVLLGEMHGSREIPPLVGDLVAHEVRDASRVVLALEITSLDQPVVDRYMNSAGNRADTEALLAGSHWQDPNHDGRDSQAMFALIERMHSIKHHGTDVAVDFFDAPGDGERNQRMAEHLRALVQREPRAVVLVLTGNIHAMTASPPWGMLDSSGKPIAMPPTAGQRLIDLHPLSINIDAAGGEAWNCQNDGCKPHPMFNRGPQKEATLEYSKPAESAWMATLTLPRFTASPPAVSIESK